MSSRSDVALALLRLSPLAFVALVACGPAAKPATDTAATSTATITPLPPASRPTVHFAYETVDRGTLSSETLAGRVSIIGFVASYDFASQAEARHLANLAHHHVPRINVALIVLEPPENWPLVPSFASTFAPGLPVAQGDPATIAGAGPFAGLHHVPSVVILDREGREAWRHLGLLDEAALDAAARAVERTDTAPPAP